MNTTEDIETLRTCRDHWKTAFEHERENVIRLRREIYASHGGKCACRDCQVVREHWSPLPVIFAPPENIYPPPGPDALPFHPQFPVNDVTTAAYWERLREKVTGTLTPSMIEALWQPPAPKPSETLYGQDGWETVFTSIEEAVEHYTDNGDSIDEAIWPAKFLEYRHAEKPSAEGMLEDVLEKLDELVGDPNGDSTVPTPKMLEAMKVILDEYQVWACEETGKKVVVTKEEAKQMLA